MYVGDPLTYANDNDKREIKYLEVHVAEKLVIDAREE